MWGIMEIAPIFQQAKVKVIVFNTTLLLNVVLNTITLIPLLMNLQLQYKRMIKTEQIRFHWLEQTAYYHKNWMRT